ncbi:hypothetical protein C2S52_017773 [Perilla frutescens var. hirtella]|nr:hypothetical protein C2S52_017773 [Perilla frutescens var. hirtella]
MIEDKHADNTTSDQDSDDDESDDLIDARLRAKALIEFRFRVEEAIIGNYLLAKQWKPKTAGTTAVNSDVRLWGVPLFPSQGHEATDAVLTKFLKAKRYKVHEAFTALRKTLKWRGDFRPNDLAGGDNAWFRSGADMEGRPLCYNILGKDYQSYDDYLRWRVVCVEKGVHNLNFRPGGVDSIVQIIDLKNAAGPATKELKLISKKMITLLHDHYPGLVHKNLIINVPSWFLTLNALNLRLITKRSKNKFIFVKPSRVIETLLKYATIENILVQYGGLRRENDTEFTSEDKVLEANIRASGTEIIQIPANEAGVTLTWDITVIGYEVTCKEEFVPDDDCSYKILLEEKRMGESMRNSFYIREPGKIVISIVNASYTKKKAYYRYKSRAIVPMFMIFN